MALALAGLCGGLSAHSETLPLPTVEEPQLNPQLEQPLELLLPTLLDFSTLLVSRLRERVLQQTDLQDSLSKAGGKLSFSDQLSLKLWQSLNAAEPLLQSLQTDLLGISSSLSGLQTDFKGVSSSLEEYFSLFKKQIGEVKDERDAARLQASLWRKGALIAGGVAVASLVALVIVIAWKKEQT